MNNFSEKNKPSLILIGGGGHCRACIDVIECEGKYDIAGIVDMKEKINQEVIGYKIIASDDELPELSEKYSLFFITLGQIKSPDRRVSIFDQLIKLKVTIPTIISPLSHVSGHATIGTGTIIMHHAMVNAGAVIGKNCIINSKSLIEHDVKIGEYCHISTGAIINGHSVIGDKTFIGSNSVCHETVKVGSNSIIGSNSRLDHHIEDNSFIKSG